MDYTAAKITNIVIGFVSLGLESFNYGDAQIRQNMDEIFIAVVSVCTLEAIISLLLSCCCQNKVWAFFDQIVRCIVCMGLIAVGFGLIYSAIDINKLTSCELIDKLSQLHCQHYEIKIAAGALAVVNGLIYGSTKKKQQPQKGAIQTPANVTVATPVVPNQVVQGREMHYLPQQDHRFRAHQNYNYSQNYGSTPPVNYPRQNNPLRQNTSPYQYQYNYYNPNQQHGFNSHQYSHNPNQQPGFNSRQYSHNPNQQHGFNPQQYAYNYNPNQQYNFNSPNHQYNYNPPSKTGFY